VVGVGGGVVVVGGAGVDVVVVVELPGVLIGVLLLKEDVGGGAGG
jgi:hypothetical protein